MENSFNERTLNSVSRSHAVACVNQFIISRTQALMLHIDSFIEVRVSPPTPTLLLRSWKVLTAYGFINVVSCNYELAVFKLLVIVLKLDTVKLYNSR